MGGGGGGEILRCVISELGSYLMVQCPDIWVIVQMTRKYTIGRMEINPEN